MDSIGVNFDEEIWPQVADIVLKALIAGEHDFSENSYRSMPKLNSAYELWEIDIAIDENLKLWLLEMNPSQASGQGFINNGRL
jgi:tubulin polyglutamylase TTLL4